jgi:hypothetical protein
MVKQIKRLTAPFAKAYADNPRLMWLSVGALSICWFLGFSWLMDRIDANKDRLMDRATYYSSIGKLAKEDDWPAHQKASAALHEELKKQLWPTQTDGLSRASFQSFLTQASNLVRIQKLDVKVGKPTLEKKRKDFLKLTGQITFPFQRGKAEALMVFLDKSKRYVYVESFDINQKGRVRLVVSTLMRKRTKKTKVGRL